MLTKGLPFWNITGMVTEARPLLTKVDKQVWAYSITVMAPGMTFEFQTKDVDLYNSVGEGTNISAEGHFGEYNRKTIFNVLEINGKNGAQYKAEAEKRKADEARKAA